MKDQKKKRPGRRDYLNDFKLSASGEYVYAGDVYRCQVSEDRQKSIQLRLWATVLFAAAVTVADGSIPAPAMLTLFGILPYVGQVAAVGSVIWALSRLSSAGDSVRGYVYRATVLALPRRYLFAILLSATGVMGTAIQAIIGGVGDALWWILLSVGFKVVVGAMMWRSRRWFATLTWSKV